MRVPATCQLRSPALKTTKINSPHSVVSFSIRPSIHRFYNGLREPVPVSQARQDDVLFSSAVTSQSAL